MTPPVVATARALLDRPWRHRGRGPVWFDCLGLVVTAVVANGRAVEDRQFYGREPQEDRLQEELRRQFGEPVPAAVGTIALFRGKAYPLHVGILGNYRYGGLSLIHASNEPGMGKQGPRVVEVRFAGEWTRRFIESYRVD